MGGELMITFLTSQEILALDYSFSHLFITQCRCTPSYSIKFIYGGIPAFFLFRNFCLPTRLYTQKVTSVVCSSVFISIKTNLI